MSKILNSSYLELETVCFTITSAPDDICGNLYHKSYFSGSQIHILQNGNPVSTIPAKFSHFYKCFSWHKDVVFEFKPHNGDGVSYSNLTMNSIKVEKVYPRPVFKENGNLNISLDYSPSLRFVHTQRMPYFV